MTLAQNSGKCRGWASPSPINSHSCRLHYLSLVMSAISSISPGTLVKVIATLASLFSGYLVFLNVPQPLFSHSHTWKNIRVYSDRPIPPESQAYIDKAPMLPAR